MLLSIIDVRVFTTEKQQGIISSVEADRVYVGTNSTITIKMNSTESGRLIVEIDGVNRTVAINNSKAVLNIALGVGVHNITVYYDGDYYFTPASPAHGLAIVDDKITSVITINDASLEIGKETIFTAILNGEESDKITYTVNGNATDRAVIYSGIYEVTASFAGNQTHKATSTTRYFSTDKESVNVTINSPNLVIGSPYTFTGKVNGVDNSNLVFTVNGVEGSTINVVAGTYTVVATFKGNDTHNSGSASETFEVNKTYTVVTIDDVTLTIGESVTFTGKVNDISYSELIFSINGVSGATITSVSSVTYSVTAIFTENATHYGNSTTRVFSANKTSAVIESVGAEPVYVGMESVIKVIMNNVESGFVLLEIDGGNNVSILINNYTGNYSTSLGIGMHNITVYYIGDSEYTEATPKSGIIVVNDKEATVITLDPVDLVVGEDAKITAKLNGLENDNLVYTINGVATDTISPVENIPYIVTVSFPGNSTHKAANMTQTYNTDKVATSISVNAIDTVTIGYATTITVNPSVNTGNVIIYINGTGYFINLSKTKTLTVTLPKVGKYIVNATYQANDKYLESHSSNVVAEVIDKEISAITIDANKTGEVHVSVGGNSTGNVTLYVNGENKGTKTLTDGNVDYTVEFGEGPQIVTATYSGDSKHYNSNSTVVIAGYDSTTYIYGKDITMYYGDKNSYSIRLYNSKGLIADKQVQFILNNQIYYRTTDVNGEASISLNLPIGTYVVTVLFTADSDYPSATRINTINVLNPHPESNLTITGSDVSTNYLNAKNFQVSVNENAKPLSGVDVKFTIDGKGTFYAKTNSNGVAVLPEKVYQYKPNTYKITAEYKGFKIAKNFVVKHLIVSKDKVIVKRSDINKNGYLTISYNLGNIFKNKVVTLKFVGKTYKVKVNKNGKLMFKINKNIVNKLKVNKNYKYQLIYKLDVKNRYFKVYKDKLVFTS